MKRAVNSAKQNISRNKSLAIATILIITVILSISTVLFGFGLMFRNAVKYYEKRAQVIVYFKQETPEEEIFKFRDLINDVNKVESIEYVSKQQAIEIYKKDFANDPDLIETVTLDTLPPSLGVRAKSISDLESIINNINIEKEKNAYIDEILYFKDVVGTIKTLSGIINWGSILFIITLFSISLFIISITIRLNIQSHKKEIEIMQLVGSSETNIKFPFIFEGAYYGVVGGLISSLSLLLPWYIVYFAAKDTDLYFWLTRMMADLSLSFLIGINPIFIILFILSITTIGLVIGSISSLWAVNRYLDNKE